MNCPCCHRAMAVEALPGHYGRDLELDLCTHCNVIWFDELEHVQLSGPATLKLVRDMHSRHDFDAVVELVSASCPRCDARLRSRSDRQRGVEFSSHVCVHGHGHFLSFYDFLKSKDMLRPLRGAKLKELREQVGCVGCTRCGAAVDLHTEVACTHCESPLMLLDPTALQDAVAAIHAEEQRKEAISPEEAAIDAALARARTERAFRKLDRENPDPWSRRHGKGWDLVHIVLELFTWV